MSATSPGNICTWQGPESRASLRSAVTSSPVTLYLDKDKDKEKQQKAKTTKSKKSEVI
jgi:hypothetical protein